MCASREFPPTTFWEFRSAAARFFPATKTTPRRIATFICSRASKPPVAKQSTTAMSPFPAIFLTIPSLRSGVGPAHGSPGTASATHRARAATARACSHADRAGAKDVHVLYVDGDFDDAPPDPARCQSAASLAVWLLTHSSPFWTGPPLRPEQLTVIGWSNPSRSEHPGMGSISLADLRRARRWPAFRRLLPSCFISISMSSKRTPCRPPTFLTRRD